MFKKFIPKEDIASSTSLKSSVQRQIRSKLLQQLPLLSQASVPAPPREDKDSEDDDEGEEVVVVQRKKGAGKEKREKKERGGGGGRKDKEVKDEEDEDEGGQEGEEVLTLLEVLWPKKEGLTLVKCREHISLLVLHGEPLFFQHFDGPFFPTLKLLHRYPALLPRVQVDRGAIKFVLSGANIMCPGLTSPTASLPTSNLPVGTPVAVYAAGKEYALGIGQLMMSIDDIRNINKNVGVENLSYLGDDLWSVGKI